LLEIIDICKNIGLKTIADLRDQPDLDYFEYNAKSKIEKFFYFFYNKLLQTYVYNGLKKADYVSVVGEISTSIVKKKLKKDTVYNVHNGFFQEDREFVESLSYGNTRDIFTIVWVGNIYRFRDTSILRDILARLDVLAKEESIMIEHFGTLTDSLKNYITRTFDNLIYRQTQDNDRKSFLKKLSTCDMFLLSCSDSLIWEPTTTVFDYILFDKPVLFSGLKNNEAYNILMHCGINTLDKYDLNKNIFEKKHEVLKNDISDYNRDKSYKDFDKIVSMIEDEIRWK